MEWMYLQAKTYPKPWEGSFQNYFYDFWKHGAFWDFSNQKVTVSAPSLQGGAALRRGRFCLSYQRSR
jgi:hypothetical protein